MYGKLTVGGRKFGVWLTAAMLVFGAALAVAAGARAPMTRSPAGWARNSRSSPRRSTTTCRSGGKLTFVFDSEENVVRVCTRSTDKQSQPVAHGFRRALQRDADVHARHALLHDR